LASGTVNNAVTLTMLPRLELAIVLTNYEGKFGTRKLSHGLSPDYNLGGYTVDRMANAQWLAREQHGALPALALGMRDIFGRVAKHQKAIYGVTRWQAGQLTLSAGLGDRALRGVFGGAQWALTPQVAAIVEGLHGTANGGFRLLPLKDFQLDAALVGFHSLGGGLSYRRRF
jgi:hypothetical protein